MRILAIGDIHGCQTALQSLMSLVQPRTEDVVVFLGDYVDRGPATRDVIETLLVIHRFCQPVFLRGNHEVMLFEARTDELRYQFWHKYGGLETLASYHLENVPHGIHDLPASHWDFLEKTRRFFETDKTIFVHGCLDPALPLAEQTDEMLYWERLEKLAPHPSGKKIICGHTHQANGEICDLGFGICIDTAAVYGGWLTCLDVNSRQWWQANEQGETRQGTLA